MVGGFNHLEKYEFVNGKYYPIYIYIHILWKIKFMFQTTNHVFIYNTIPNSLSLRTTKPGAPGARPAMGGTPMAGISRPRVSGQMGVRFFPWMFQAKQKICWSYVAFPTLIIVVESKYIFGWFFPFDAYPLVN